VLALSMGPPQAEDALRECLAIGADLGVLLCDRVFAGADTLATARALSGAVRKIRDFSVILCGDASEDSGTGSVGPQIAQLLALPHVGRVNTLSIEEGKAVATSKVTGGFVRIKVGLPAVFCLSKGINRPRLPNAASIIKAFNKPLLVWGISDIGGDKSSYGLEGSPSRVIGIVQAKQQRARLMLTGDPENMVFQALERIRAIAAFEYLST